MDRVAGRRTAVDRHLGERKVDRGYRMALLSVERNTPCRSRHTLCPLILSRGRGKERCEMRGSLNSNKKVLMPYEVLPPPSQPFTGYATAFLYTVDFCLFITLWHRFRRPNAARRRMGRLQVIVLCQ